MPITAPYNFVPLYKKAYTVDWGDQISMDIPFADGEDGTITLKITNHSPLFIGNKKEGDDSKSPLSRHIDMPDGSKRFYIPQGVFPQRHGNPLVCTIGTIQRRLLWI